MRTRHATDTRIRLIDGHPELGRAGSNKHLGVRPVDPLEEAAITRQLLLLNDVVDLRQGNAVVVGCGPQPNPIRVMQKLGIRGVGIEPVPSFVQSAREVIGDERLILEGTAEKMPLEDASMRLVYCNSVFEHVDSPTLTLAEFYRVLAPGGVALIFTTNRWYIDLRGRCLEYRVPYFNWFPKVVKESYVFRHLHDDPMLANYSTRPAVHWFTFDELCTLGRHAGFARFYTMADLVDAAREPGMRGLAYRLIRRHPWVRAAALAFTRLGGAIVMWKRG